MISTRALPRCFIEGADPAGVIVLPEEEKDKLRRVLRLRPGAEIAILPNDGRLIRCTFDGRNAVPIAVEHPSTEPELKVTVVQAAPKGDKMDEIVRACTEIGADRIAVFASERTVIDWPEAKWEGRLKRWRVIARESSELAFRTKIPTIDRISSLAEALSLPGSIVVLNESELEMKSLIVGAAGPVNVIVGPEGGWAPKEADLFSGKSVTLGPRVLRVEHAAAAALAILLLKS